MKRLHVHVGVADLGRSIGFYSTLFGAEPNVVKPDYAKWMLDDPRVNFAISKGKRAAKGVVEDATPVIEQPRGQRQQPKRKDRQKSAPRPAGTVASTTPEDAPVEDAPADKPSPGGTDRATGGPGSGTGSSKPAPKKKKQK